jgi:hypothetical protein
LTGGGEHCVGRFVVDAQVVQAHVAQFEVRDIPFSTQSSRFRQFRNCAVLQ